MSTSIFVISALCFYLVTIFGLGPLFTRGIESHSHKEFIACSPAVKWLVVAHEILSLPVFLFAMVGAPILFDIVYGSEDSLSVAVGAWLFTATLCIFNGLFEVVTGISPVYGVIIKRYYSQGFVLHPVVRRLGITRIALGIAIIITLRCIALS